MTNTEGNYQGAIEPQDQLFILGQLRDADTAMNSDNCSLGKFLF